MRIAFICPLLPPHYNGCGDATDRLAREFQRRGADTLVVTDDVDTIRHEYPVRAAGAWNARSVALTKNALDAFRPDVVLMQYTPFLYPPRSLYPFLAQMATRRYRRITYVHEAFYGADNVSVRSAKKAAYLAVRDRLVLAASETIYVAGEQRAKLIAMKAPYAASKVQCVPFGANIEPQHLEPRRAATAPYRLMAFGIVMPRRRIELLIEAVALLRTFGVEAELQVAGRIQEPDYRVQCERLAADRGISQYVHFCGPVSPDQLGKLFSGSDLFLHAAEEGAIASAGSLLAALAHGIPVLCARTNNDDPRFESSALFADPDARSLALTIREMLSQPARLQTLGEKCLDLYRREFGWARMADRIEAQAYEAQPAYAAL